jgi:hypothetical protein
LGIDYSIAHKCKVIIPETCIAIAGTPLSVVVAGGTCTRKKASCHMWRRWKTARVD